MSETNKGSASEATPVLDDTPPTAPHAAALDGANTVHQTIVSNLDAPRLNRITTPDIVEFYRLRQVYEARVAEKNSEPGVNVTAASLKSTISPDVLHIFVLAGWVDNVAKVSDLTEVTLAKSIKKRAIVEPSKYDLGGFEAEVAKIRIEKADNCVSLFNQVWTVVLKYKKLLTKHGYSNFLEKQAKIAVQHILQILPNTNLRKRMALNLRLRKEELEADVTLFVRECAKEAEAIDHQEVARRAEDPREDNVMGTYFEQKPGRLSGGKGKHTKPTEGKMKTPRGGSSKDGGEKAANKRKAPDCLNPKCDGQHFINECPITSDSEKKRLKKEYHDTKRESGNASAKTGKRGAVGSVKSSENKTADSDATGQNSALFSISLCAGAVETEMLADQGSCMCALPAHVVDQMTKANPDLRVQTLPDPLTFNLAALDAEPLICTRELRADAEMRIRHGEKLVLRGVKWLAPTNNIAHAYLGRHVLSALGLDNRALIAAAKDRLGPVIDVPDLLAKSGADDSACAPENNTPTVGSILRDRGYEWGSSFHSTACAEDDDVDGEETYIDIGDDPDEALQEVLDQRIEEAAADGLTPAGKERLQGILTKYRKVFRLRLGGSQPAKVEPMRIRLQENSRPVKAKARRYSQDQRRFLDDYIARLLALGFLIETATAEWQAAPLLVPKASRAQFRLTVDLRPVNSATIKEAWPMPHVDSEVYDFAGSVCFAIIDFVSGYWQLPLHPDSRSACGIVTPNGVYMSTRVLQGLANATAHFQRTVEPLFAPLRPHLKAWLDDFIIHAKNENTLLDVLEKFVSICAEHGLFLSAKKSKLFTRRIKWCGRVVSAEGFEMDPSRSEALVDISKPETAAELGEFVYCTRWMSLAIPDFATRVAPLNDVLEEAYAKSKRRTKRSIQGIKLTSLSWGPDHEKRFRELQENLRNSVTLSIPDTQKVTCVYTDASDRFWSAVVTQVEEAQLALPLEEQRHLPMAFLGSAFRGSELGWSTFEKEAFAIFKTFEKLDYLLIGQTRTRVFTDHRNLLFVFAPLAIEPTLGRHIVSKVQRWALYLSRFSYLIKHISGVDNTFADILTRWMKGHRNVTKRLSTCSISVRDMFQVVPAASNIVWPDIEVLREGQSKASDRPTDLQWDEQVSLWKKDSLIWIPDADAELQLKVIVASHCGYGGHRAIAATESSIREAFYWSNIHEDVAEFVRGCLHCLVTRSGDVIPRPLGSALHAQKTNEVLHMDFLFMGPSNSGRKYVLLLRDDLSGYVWLYPTDSCTADDAVDALQVWIGVFGTMEWLVSDQGTQLKNQLVKGLAERARVNHHFTTPHCPWANGSIERICREVLRACRALLSEWKLQFRDWPRVSESVQSILNHAPRERLGPRDKAESRVFRTPLEVFTGQRPVRPLLEALPPTAPHSAADLTEARARQLINLDKICDALDQVHRDVETRVSKKRRKKIDRHNQQTNICAVRFSPGDLVLVRRAVRGGHKLDSQWRGPRRIVDAKSDWVYVVEDILTGQRETAHARRLALYRADQEGNQPGPELLDAVQHSNTHPEIARDIHAIRRVGNKLEVLVEWEGLPSEGDHTWEPCSLVAEDLPGVLEDFLQTSGNRALKRRALEDYFKSA